MTYMSWEIEFITTFSQLNDLHKYQNKKKFLYVQQIIREIGL